MAGLALLRCVPRNVGLPIRRFNASLVTWGAISSAHVRHFARRFIGREVLLVCVYYGGSTNVVRFYAVHSVPRRAFVGTTGKGDARPLPRVLAIRLCRGNRAGKFHLIIVLRDLVVPCSVEVSGVLHAQFYRRGFQR